MRVEVIRQKKLESGIQNLETKANQNVLKKVCLAWRGVIGANSQRKFLLRALEKRVRRRQRRDLERNTFSAWWDATVGPGSSRELVKRNEARMKAARQVLFERAQARGETGLLITPELVRMEMNRQAVALMLGKVDTNTMGTVVTRLQVAVQNKRRQEAEAALQFRRTVMR
ncbi:unnamed protein product [Discosporangium mesarthrocarpum]